jgi:hypothetical protein
MSVVLGERASGRRCCLSVRDAGANRLAALKICYRFIVSAAARPIVSGADTPAARSSAGQRPRGSIAGRVAAAHLAAADDEQDSLLCVRADGWPISTTTTATAKIPPGFWCAGHARLGN